MTYNKKETFLYKKIIALIIFSLIVFTSLNFDSKSNHSITRRRNVPLSECNIASSLLTELVFNKPFLYKRLKRNENKSFIFFNSLNLNFKYFNLNTSIQKNNKTIFDTDTSPPTTI